MALRLPRRLRKLVVVALAIAILLTALFYGWVRDSSLVAVRDVQIIGLTGPDAPRLREQLKQVALEMTTLHVREDELRQAVATEPTILALRATPDFPHGLRIDVLENHPVAAISVPGSGVVPIAGNGTLMPGAKTSSAVPELRVQGAARLSRVSGAPVRLNDDRAAALLRVAAAAPEALLRRAQTIEQRSGEGIVVTLRNGPVVIFGDDSRLPDKWRGAAGVLASSDAAGATYVDVRIADRPVAGGLRSPLSGTATGTSTYAPSVAASPQTAATPASTTPATASAAPAQTTPSTPSTPAPGSASPPAQASPAAPSATPAGTASSTSGGTVANSQP
jgi:cell division protein FtsQ